MPVTLVRHTQPDVAADICYGSTDLKLAESFADEAADVVAALRHCEVLISSPLLRCKLLADVIADRFSVAVQIDERLREMDFGRWEGRAWTEIPRVEIAMWSEDFMHARPHGGESVAMLHARTRDVLADYQDSEQHHVFVTHSGVIKAALSNGDTAADFDSKIEFGGIVQIK